MSFLGDLFKIAYPLLLKALQALADSGVKGDEMSLDNKRLIYGMYPLLKTFGQQLVNDSDNPYDDEAMATLISWCEDTLTEAGLTIPSVPAELLP